MQTTQPPQRGADPAPMSVAQQALWVLNQTDPRNTAYNAPLAYRIRGALNRAALQAAADHIVARHSAFRTGFSMIDGAACQWVADHVPVTLEVVRTASQTAQQQTAWLEAAIEERLRLPFDLARPPLIRFSCFELGQEEHLLLIVVHHIVSDGWSLHVFMSQFGAAYSAYSNGASVAAGTPTPTIAEHALDERAWLSSDEARALLEATSERLRGLEPLEFRPTATACASGGVVHFKIDCSLDRLKQLAGQLRATPFMVLAAVLQLLLWRYSGQSNFAIGTPAAARSTRFEQTVGYFANMLVMRAKLAGDPSFAKLVQRVRETTLEALTQQQMPFAAIATRLTHAEAALAGRNPIFQVAFGFNNTPVFELRLGELSIEELPIEALDSPFDLTLMLRERDGGLVGRLRYRPSLFGRSQIEKMVQNFETLLNAAIDNPHSAISRLDMLAPSQREQIHRWSVGPNGQVVDRLVHRLIEDRVDSAPAGVAIESDDIRLTYDELDRRANRIARALIEFGVTPDQPVAVLCDSRALGVLGALAIMKAGGCFLPIDAKLPLPRIDFMLADSGCAVVVTERRCEQLLANQRVRRLLLDDAQANASTIDSSRPVVPNLNSDHLAYLIYTSGSTGTPKAVMCRHRALASRCSVPWAVPLGPNKRQLLVSSPSFDISVLEVFATLCTGATLCIAPADQLYAGPPLRDTLERMRITHVFVLPSALAILPVDPPLPNLEVIFCGGETCPPELAEKWSQRVPVMHAYGPTEATIFATVLTCRGTDPWRGSGTLPIGFPIADTSIYVLDADLNPVPEGVTGEIVIGGLGVAKGYRGASELTRLRFVPDPFAADRARDTSSEHQLAPQMYRTGDLGRWLADGSVQWLGRADEQVKVRGHRIEPAEIEVVLAQCTGVLDAVVVAPIGSDGDRRLAAFVRLSDTPTASDAAQIKASIRAHLAQALPGYMVPASIDILDSLPRLSNDKFDRKALTRLASARAVESDHADAAATMSPLEARIASIWSEVIKVPITAATDNFFTVGGHSLSAAGVAGRIADRFSIKFGIADVFDAPTVAAMAALVNERESDRAPMHPAPKATPGAPACEPMTLTFEIPKSDD